MHFTLLFYSIRGFISTSHTYFIVQ